MCYSNLSSPPPNPPGKSRLENHGHFFLPPPRCPSRFSAERLFSGGEGSKQNTRVTCIRDAVVVPDCFAYVRSCGPQPRPDCDLTLRSYAIIAPPSRQILAVRVHVTALKKKKKSYRHYYVQAGARIANKCQCCTKNNHLRAWCVMRSHSPALPAPSKHLYGPRLGRQDFANGGNGVCGAIYQ